MSIIVHLQQQNENLRAENEALKADIKQVANSVRSIWNVLDIDPKLFETSNKMVLVSKLLPKIGKKEVQETFTKEWANSIQILDKYKHLIAE